MKFCLLLFGKTSLGMFWPISRTSIPFCGFMLFLGFLGFYVVFVFFLFSTIIVVPVVLSKTTSLGLLSSIRLVVFL